MSVNVSSANIASHSGSPPSSGRRVPAKADANVFAAMFSDATENLDPSSASEALEDAGEVSMPIPMSAPPSAEALALAAPQRGLDGKPSEFNIDGADMRLLGDSPFRVANERVGAAPGISELGLSQLGLLGLRARLGEGLGEKLAAPLAEVPGNHRAAWSDFLHRMSRLGATPERLLRAFKSLSHQDLKRPPEMNIDKLVASLGLSGQQAILARVYFKELIQTTGEPAGSASPNATEPMARRASAHLPAEGFVHRKTSDFDFPVSRGADEGEDDAAAIVRFDDSVMGRKSASEGGDSSQRGVLAASGPSASGVRGVRGVRGDLQRFAPTSLPASLSSASEAARSGSPGASSHRALNSSVSPGLKNSDQPMVSTDKQNIPSPDVASKLGVTHAQRKPTGGAQASRDPSALAALSAFGLNGRIDQISVESANRAQDGILPGHDRDRRSKDADGGDDDQGSALSAGQGQGDVVAPKPLIESAGPSGAANLGGAGALGPLSRSGEVSQSSHLNPSSLAHQSQPMAVPDLVQQAHVMVRDGGGEMKVKLHPEGLGEVAMRVSVDNGRVSVQMVTESDEAKKLIERQVSDLKSSLASNHLHVDSVHVDTASNMGRQLEQHFHDAHREQARQWMQQSRGDSQGSRRNFFLGGDGPNSRDLGVGRGGSESASSNWMSPARRSGDSRRLDLVA